MRIALWMSTALLILAFPSPGLSDVKVQGLDDDGNMTAPSDKLELNENGHPVPVWLGYEGYTPYAVPKKNSARVELAKPLGFMEQFYYAEKHQERGGKQDFRLLVRVNKSGTGLAEKDPYVGWVEKEYLVMEPNAIKDSRTKIHRKGLIVNSLDFIKSTPDKKNLEALTFRYGPRPDAKGKDDPERLYHVLFVYAEADGYVLLGSSPTIDTLHGAQGMQDAMYGWLPKERICIWNTREGCEWDSESTHPTAGKQRRQKPGQILRTVEEAEKYLQTGQGEAVFQEYIDPKTGVSINLKPGDPRFPILSRDAVAESKIGGELFHVGGIGDVVDTKGKILMSKAKRDAMQRQLADLEKAAKRTEILFVIDNTASMDLCSEIAAKLCLEITKSVKEAATVKGNKHEVLIGLTYYRDRDAPFGQDEFEDKKGPFLGKKPTTYADGAVLVRPLRDVSKEGENIAAELTYMAGKIKGGGDALEMVFAGLVEGIEHCDFTGEGGKIIVLLGDCGDITASPKRLAKAPKYVKDYNVAKIGELLAKNGELPAAFLACQVVEVKGDQDYLAFQNQANEIIGEQRDRVKKLMAPEASSDYFESGNRDAIERKIRRGYELLADQTAQINKDLNRLRRGQHTVLSPWTRELLKNRGMLEYIEALDGYQLFDYGYVWTRHPEGCDQLRKKLLLNDGELLRTIELLARLDHRQGRPSVKELLTAIIKTQAGEQAKKDPKLIDELSFESLIKMKEGLIFRNGLLTKRLKQIEDGENAQLQVQLNELHRILKQKMILEDIRAGRAYEYDEIIDNKNFGGLEVRKWQRKTKGIDDQRFFYMPGDQELKWYWIDFVREWP